MFNFFRFRSGYASFSTESVHGTESEHGNGKRVPGSSVEFLGVANKQSIVIAAHNHYTKIDIDSIQNVLRQLNISIRQYMYSFSVEQFGWHVVEGIASVISSAYSYFVNRWKWIHICTYYKQIISTKLCTRLLE
jgi:hypothetical protein